MSLVRGQVEAAIDYFRSIIENFWGSMSNPRCLNIKHVCIVINHIWTEYISIFCIFHGLNHRWQKYIFLLILCSRKNTDVNRILLKSIIEVYLKPLLFIYEYCIKICFPCLFIITKPNWIMIKYLSVILLWVWLSFYHIY